MTDINDVDDLHSLAAAYAVDALDQDERARFEAHLSGCDRCTAEVAELSESLAALSWGFELEAPVALRGSILDAIAEVEQEPAEPRPVSEPAGTATVSEVAVPAAPRHASAEVVSLSDFRSRRAGRVLALAVAAAMVVALALGGWVIRLNSQLNQQQQVADAQAQSDARLLAAPDARVYPIKTDSANFPAGAHISYVVSKQLNQAQVVAVGMPALTQDQIYQLWTVRGGPSYTSAGTFGESGRVKVNVQGDVETAGALAITVEQSNSGRGATQPNLDSAFAIQPID